MLKNSRSSLLIKPIASTISSYSRREVTKVGSDCKLPFELVSSGTEIPNDWFLQRYVHSFIVFIARKVKGSRVKSPEEVGFNKIENLGNERRHVKFIRLSRLGPLTSVKANEIYFG